MENKKLLEFLLKDLNELDELFGERENGWFDKLEIDFFQSRLKSSKKLVQLLIERQSKKEDPAQEKQKIADKPGTKQEISSEATDIESNVKNTLAEEVPVETKEETENVNEQQKHAKELIQGQTETANEDEPGKLVEIKEVVVESQKEPDENKPETITEEDEMELEEEEEVKSKRLGDSFLKEKSVNDILSGETDKLEHKISNRPVSSIQAAIGINDRFQYIRELFEGDAELFSKTIAELDRMDSLKNAIHYLQQNFKWRKSDTSLQFINLVKRRFANV